ncbi:MULTISPECIES: ribbon-helix-helix domain-containing protein [Amycolatopsis]|uniref:Antitoxin n=1 Tax=Amycolatopsis tucumanensis TaxID=401106 RepID=A0ABP7I6M5_9PSEU|nr:MULTISPECIES: ribbon-helix-helix domain-containing protein [Amycolatopsis]
MTKQIAVRLPDDLVSFIDHVVEEGGAASRAELVFRALERERRRLLAERDIALLTGGVPDDLAGIEEHAAPLDDLD